MHKTVQPQSATMNDGVPMMHSDAVTMVSHRKPLADSAHEVTLELDSETPDELPCDDQKQIHGVHNEGIGECLQTAKGEMFRTADPTVLWAGWFPANVTEEGVKAAFGADDDLLDVEMHPCEDSTERTFVTVRVSNQEMAERMLEMQEQACGNVRLSSESSVDEPQETPQAEDASTICTNNSARIIELLLKIRTFNDPQAAVAAAIRAVDNLTKGKKKASVLGRSHQVGGVGASDGGDDASSESCGNAQQTPREELPDHQRVIEETYPNCHRLVKSFREQPNTQNKTPLAIIHEYASRLGYELTYEEIAETSVGPFTVTARLKEVDRELAVGRGRGRGKKDAKQVAAAAVIESMLLRGVRADDFKARDKMRFGPGSSNHARGLSPYARFNYNPAHALHASFHRQASDASRMYGARASRFMRSGMSTFAGHGGTGGRSLGAAGSGGSHSAGSMDAWWSNNATSQLHSFGQHGQGSRGMRSSFTPGGTAAAGPPLSAGSNMLAGGTSSWGGGMATDPTGATLHLDNSIQMEQLNRASSANMGNMIANMGKKDSSGMLSNALFGSDAQGLFGQSFSGASSSEAALLGGAGFSQQPAPGRAYLQSLSDEGSRRASAALPMLSNLNLDDAQVREFMGAICRAGAADGAGLGSAPLHKEECGGMDLRGLAASLGLPSHGLSLEGGAGGPHMGRNAPSFHLDGSEES